MRFGFLILTFIVCSYLNGQTPQYGDIFNHISSTISALPANGGDDYVAPTPSQLETWDTLITELLLHHHSAAANIATSLEYNFIAFWDTTLTPNKQYFLLEKQSASSHHWGTYIINPSPCNYDLVLQAPHPRADFNTGKQGIYILRKANAFAYMLSGTHRCNSLSPSSCTGTTSSCGSGSQAYRISDLAHNSETIFQKTTEVLYNTVAPHFVQLHGFTKLSSDPYVILSNGTQVTPVDDPIVDIRDGLLAADPVLTFKIAHIDTTWTRLRGFWNTQGRMLNNSPNPCTQNASTSQGAFVHLEQEKTRLRLNSTGWDKLNSALKTTFPCQILPVELIRFDVKKENENALLKWQIGAKENFSHFEIERSTNGIDFEFIKKINPNEPYNFVDNIQNINTAYIYYRLKINDLDNSYEFSKIKKIDNIKTTDFRISPNPASNQLRVSFSNGNENPKKIIIRSVLGKTGFSKNIGLENSIQIEIEELPKGIYFVEFWEHQQRQQTQRILIL